MTFEDLLKNNPWTKPDIDFEGLLRMLRKNTPSYSPLDTSGLSLLKARIAEADRLAKDPLSSAGAQKALEAINLGAARRAEFERGAAIGRGAATGGNAFSGSLAQTAGDISSRQNDAITTMTGDLANKLMQQYREEGRGLAQAYAAATSDLNRTQAERDKARSDWEAQMAALLKQAETARQKGMSDWATQMASLLRQTDAERYRALMDQARIAEEARQFDVLHPNGQHPPWMDFAALLFHRLGR
jgi:hypothetical protein